MPRRTWILLVMGALLPGLIACSLPFLPTQATPTIRTTPSCPIPPIIVATPTLLPESVIVEATAGELLLINIYERVNPGVINIDVAQESAGEISPFGSGSGFLIDLEGHIVTNNHVIERADVIWATFSDGSVRQAQVLGADTDSDLAVLLVEDLPAGAVPLELGDSDTLQVGQQVIAIGNPFGLQGTMTVGIVSALGRLLPARISEEGGYFRNPEIIQTDTPINPGNSGGPLLDLHGRVVGINTAIRTTSGFNMGIGFAVPINTAKRILPHLIEEGVYRYPYLGIGADDRFSLAQLAPELGLSVSQGVLVASVVPNSPAHRAGILGGDREVTIMGQRGVRVGGDIIIAINDYTVRDFSDLIAYLIRETEVGQVVTLTVLRDGQELQLPVQLGERPQ